MNLDCIKPLPTFKPALRQAIRDRRKFMTRRVVKPQPPKLNPEPTLPALPAIKWPEDKGCRHGKAGEIRYLREPLVRTLLRVEGKRAKYVAAYKDDMFAIVSDGKFIKWRWKQKVLSSMFMPKEYARTFVKLTEVRGEWLHDITEADAKAEGVDSAYCHNGGAWECESNRTYLADFRHLWNEINAKRNLPFDSNPYVKVIAWEFIETKDIK